jgi:uncharacterized protein (TIGR02246 family)
MTEEEAAIRETLALLARGFSQKDGTLFASAFAPVHDYVVINGMLLTGFTREANAKIHQDLFDGARMGSLGHNLRTMAPPRQEVKNVRILAPGVAVAHVASQGEGQDATMVTAVLQKLDEGWRITAYHNAPVLGGGPPAGRP